MGLVRSEPVTTPKRIIQSTRDKLAVLRLRIVFGVLQPLQRYLEISHTPISRLQHSKQRLAVLCLYVRAALRGPFCSEALLACKFLSLLLSSKTRTNRLDRTSGRDIVADGLPPRHACRSFSARLSRSADTSEALG